MSEKKELTQEQLEKATGGVDYGSFVKPDTTYWVCPICGAEILASYTFIARHLFRDHKLYATEDEAYDFAKTITWWR